MKIKKQVETLSEMMDYTSSTTSQVTDFSIGSAIRAMYDSFSIETEQIYMLTIENIQEGIERGLMESFDFKPRPALRAYGEITVEFYNESDDVIIIPRGSLFRSSDSNVLTVYTTLIAYVVEPGNQTAFIDVECTEPGIKGNTEAGKIDTTDLTLFNVKSVTNAHDFLTGSEEETYLSVKSRFQMFIEARGRATKKSLKWGAMSVDSIQGAYVDERPGVAFVYCHDKNGNLPDTLWQEVVNAEEDYRPAGIELHILPMVKREVDLDITVIASDLNLITEDFKDKLNKFTRNYLNSFSGSEDLVLADLIQEIMNFEDNIIYDCYVTNQKGNLIINSDQIIRAGKVTIKYE